MDLGPIQPQTCDRCGRKTVATMMSFFNTDACCPFCISKEKSHPMYPYAVMMENEALRKGVRDYPGIGLPKDLEEWAKLERENVKNG